MKIIAHRGASGERPENTFASFERALEIGVDFIEVDVRLSADGEIFIFHDAKLNRTSNGKGPFSKKNSNYLKTLDAGYWYDSKYSGQRIPTFHDLMDFINGKTRILLELKRTRGRNHLLFTNLINQIRDRNCYDQIIVQSFGKSILESFHRLEPRIELNKLIVFKPARAPIYYDGKIRRGDPLQSDFITGINVDYRYITKRLVDKIHDSNKKIFAWTTDYNRSIDKMVSLGIDGIITNYPAKVKAYLNK